MQKSRKYNFRKVLVCSLAGLMLSSCALVPEEDFQQPPLLRDRAGPTGEGSGAIQQESFQSETLVERMPDIPQPSLPVQNVRDIDLFPEDEEETILLSFDGIPLPGFINEIFGNQLGLDFVMDPQVANKNDLVTIRITEPRNRAGIFDESRDVLEDYGVSIVQRGDILNFVLGTTANTTEAPLIVTGQALPNVPETHRPVYLIRSMVYIENQDAYSMLSAIFEQSDMDIDRYNERNALSIRGKSSDVKKAAEVLDMLDTPAMKGRQSLRIEPVFVDAETLAASLQEVMTAQGFDIGEENNTTLVTVPDLNVLFVFAANETVLQTVRGWIPQLDRLSVNSDREDAIFWHQVKNTNAQKLAETLNAIMGESGSRSSRNGSTSEDQSDDDSVGEESSGSTQIGNFVVDPARNMLMYRGTAERWQEIMPLIDDLDVASPQVLIEVIVAEVSLNESFKFGMEWGLSGLGSGQQGDLTSIFGNSDVGSGISATGLRWNSLSSSGATRLAISAFANDNNISILQTPRVLVRSGETATVNVGQSVPVISSNSVGDEIVDGNTSVTQQIAYRDVGISLTVTPTVFSGRRVDLQIAQDVSSSIGDASTVDLTPSFSQKNLNTSLSLEDGGSVLLAGLISTTQSMGNSRVPVLGKLPVLGQLFRADSTSADRSELMILIVPYIIEDPAQAEAITESFREQLRLSSEDSVSSF